LERTDPAGGVVDAGVASAMALDAAGNVYVTGTSLSVEGAYGYATVKYDSDGNQLWVARYHDPFGTFGGGDVAQAIAVDIASNVYVTGISCGFVDPDLGCLQTDFATVKYAQVVDF
jgi:hypothetical protein